MLFSTMKPGVAPGVSSAPQSASRLGVLLCNLGTPDAPTPAATRRYLAEFLSDSRVVELPRALWLPLLYGAVLTTRPAQSARKYQSIWTPEGSPLMVWSQKQAALLRGYLGERGLLASVRLAMRYGQPAVGAQLDALMQQDGCRRVLVLPLYPQYSGSTTASVVDAVGRWAQKTRALPELRFVNRFGADVGYIRALARRTQRYWQDHGRPDVLVMSFHGLPERMVQRGDPYQRECQTTARLLAVALGLREGQWRLSFQSRFGRARWIGPATQDTLRELGAARTGRVDVLCPGFVSDCVETLEEIAQEGRDEFLRAGGGAFHHIACLNDSPDWLAALADLTLRHTQGWR